IATGITPKLTVEDIKRWPITVMREVCNVVLSVKGSIHHVLILFSKLAQGLPHNEGLLSTIRLNINRFFHAMHTDDATMYSLAMLSVSQDITKDLKFFILQKLSKTFPENLWIAALLFDFQHPEFYDIENKKTGYKLDEAVTKLKALAGKEREYPDQYIKPEQIFCKALLNQENPEAIRGNLNELRERILKALEDISSLRGHRGNPAKAPVQKQEKRVAGSNDDKESVRLCLGEILDLFDNKKQGFNPEEQINQVSETHGKYVSVEMKKLKELMEKIDKILKHFDSFKLEENRVFSKRETERCKAKLGTDDSVKIMEILAKCKASLITGKELVNKAMGEIEEEIKRRPYIAEVLKSFEGGKMSLNPSTVLDEILKQTVSLNKMSDLKRLAKALEDMIDNFELFYTEIGNGWNISKREVNLFTGKLGAGDPKMIIGMLKENEEILHKVNGQVHEAIKEEAKRLEAEALKDQLQIEPEAHEDILPKVARPLTNEEGEKLKQIEEGLRQANKAPLVLEGEFADKFLALLGLIENAGSEFSYQLTLNDPIAKYIKQLIDLEFAEGEIHFKITLQDFKEPLQATLDEEGYLTLDNLSKELQESLPAIRATLMKLILDLIKQKSESSEDRSDENSLGNNKVYFNENPNTRLLEAIANTFVYSKTNYKKRITFKAEETFSLKGNPTTPQMIETVLKLMKETCYFRKLPGGELVPLTTIEAKKRLMSGEKVYRFCYKPAALRVVKNPVPQDRVLDYLYSKVLMTLKAGMDPVAETAYLINELLDQRKTDSRIEVVETQGNSGGKSLKLRQEQIDYATKDKNGTIKQHVAPVTQFVFLVEVVLREV
ncbi:MAG: hypothetical protein AABZ14_05310, partial [Candidatus Margulisiibacteriota bacterium]